MGVEERPRDLDERDDSAIGLRVVEDRAFEIIDEDLRLERRAKHGASPSRHHEDVREPRRRAASRALTQEHRNDERKRSRALPLPIDVAPPHGPGVHMGPQRVERIGRGLVVDGDVDALGPRVTEGHRVEEIGIQRSNARPGIRRRLELQRAEIERGHHGAREHVTELDGRGLGSTEHVPHEHVVPRPRTARLGAHTPMQMPAPFRGVAPMIAKAWRRSKERRGPSLDRGWSAGGSHGNERTSSACSSSPSRTLFGAHPGQRDAAQSHPLARRPTLGPP